MTAQSRTEQFRSHVTKAAKAYAGLDKNPHGRNRSASHSNARYHVAAAQAVLSAACKDETDPLPEYLDSPKGARLAEKFQYVERRLYGLPVTTLRGGK